MRPRRAESLSVPSTAGKQGESLLYLDELAPLVLLHVQIKPLRLDLEHLCRKLLNCVFKQTLISQLSDSRIV